MARPSFVRAFLSSVLGTGLSRVFGLFRDVAVGYFLGAGASADAFWMAWTVPNAFRRFVADEGLTGALVPAVARAEADDGTPAAQSLANRILTALLLANAGIVALGMAAPEVLVYMFAYGFTSNPEKYALTVEMTRWLMPFLAMVSLVSFFEGLLNHRGHFFVPKVAPGLVSAGIVAMAVLFGTSLEEPAWAMVAGVWVGGIVHVVVHAPFVARLWGGLRLNFDSSDPRFRSVVRELGKVVVIGIFAQINLLVLRQMASLMIDGSVSRYTYATRLVDLSQGIIAVAIGSALLPNISGAVAEGDWGRFKSDLTGALRLAAFLLIPAAVGLFIYAVPLTAMVYLRGKFTVDDLVNTAQALQLMMPFMLGVAGVNILKKVFFALEQRNSLLVVGGLGVATTGIVGFLLLDLGINGLAIALSVATVAQLGVYVALLKVQLEDRMPLGELVVPLLKMTLATLPMAVFAFWCASRGRWTEGFGVRNLLYFFAGVGGGGGLYALAAWMLGVEELRSIVGKVTARFRR